MESTQETPPNNSCRQCALSFIEGAEGKSAEEAGKRKTKSFGSREGFSVGKLLEQDQVFYASSGSLLSPGYPGEMEWEPKKNKV